MTDPRLPHGYAEEMGIEDTDRCRCGHILADHAQDPPYDLACTECECESFEEPEYPDWTQE